MQKTLSLFYTLIFCAALASEASAAGEATRFVIHIQKVELKTAAGDWKTAFEGDLPLDLAAPEPRASFENKLAPEGSYVGVRLQLDETVEVAGSDGPAMTSEGGVIEITGTAATLADLPGQIQTLIEKKPTHNQKSVGLIRVTVDYDYADRDKTIEVFATRDLNKPIIVKTNSNISISLRADLNGSIIHVWPGYYGDFPAGDAVIFSFPKSFSDFSVKVDGSTGYAGGKIDVKF